MKKQALTLSLFLLILSNCVYAQYSSNFVVQGDLDKYYPVTFLDASFSNNKATEFDIGRANVHTDVTWRGSLIAKFRMHTTNWGNGSNFIDADIRQFNALNYNTFIAGWVDVTTGNNNTSIVIWLRGGGTTYYYNSQANIGPVVYDGVQHGLPYQETNGPAHTFKTVVDSYVNSNGMSIRGTAYYNGGGNSYFAGNVGIGTTSPDTKLAVNGTIHSKEIKVDLTNWPDYVFKPNYDLLSLDEVKTYISKNQHLPDMPSEQDVSNNGVRLGEMVKLQTKKIEELTLYLIEKNKEIKQQQRVNQRQAQINQAQQTQINQLVQQLTSITENLNKNKR